MISHRMRFRFPSFLALCLSLAAAPLAAQEESKSEVAERMKSETQQAEKAATLSKTYELLGLPRPVKFSEVLTDPNNLQLNLDYAKTQIAEGNLLSASATLERILLINPDLPAVRYMYALVLARLNSLDDARRELQLLEQGELPADVRKEVSSLRQEISHKQKRTRGSASASLGFQIDSNRNAGPSKKAILFSNSEIAVPDSSRIRRDTSLLQLYSIEAAHDLGFQEGHELIGSFDYFQGEQTAVNSYDLQAFTLKGGLKLNTQLGQITPMITLDHVLLSRETYNRSQDFSVRLDRNLTSRLNAFVESGWARDDFDGITENSAASERRGDKTHVGGGVGVALSPTMKLDFELAHLHKGAKADYWAYNDIELTGRHTWVLPHGQFFVSSLTYELDRYTDPDLATASRKREDKQLRTRLTYGLPLGIFCKNPDEALWGALKDTTGSFSFEQFRSLSNIINYTYSNSKWTWLVSKKVEF